MSSLIPCLLSTQPSAKPSAGAAQVPTKKKGAGTKMLDDLRKKGKPVTPKLEEMALWLDGLDTSTLDDGQVSFCQRLHAMQSLHAMAWCLLLIGLVSGLQCCFT